MHSTRKTVSLLGLTTSIALGLAATPAAHAQTNLLTNGSFENTSGTWAANINGGDSVPIGSTSIPGWTTTNGELAWLMSGTYGMTTPYDNYFLDLTGYHDSSPYGGVTQTLSTIVGSHYLLTFAIGSDQSTPFYSGPVSITASADSISQTFTFTAPAGSTGNQWGIFGLGFNATSTSTIISLTGNATAGGQEIGLDDVSVTAAPEPSQTAVLGLGILGLSVLAFKARRRAHIS